MEHATGISFASLIEEGFKRKTLEVQRQPDIERQTMMSKQIAELLLHSAERIPPTKPVTYKEHEGPYGILPKPAEEIIVRSTLIGETPPPVRKADEIVEQESRRTTDKATIHLLLHIDPAKSTDTEKLRAVADMMKVLSSMNLQSDSLLPMPEGPPLQIKESELDLQLLTTSGAQYALLSRRFPFPVSAESALAYYQSAFMSTMSQRDSTLGDEMTGMFHSLAAIKEHLGKNENPKEGIDIFITDISYADTSTKDYQPPIKKFANRFFGRTQAPRSSSYLAIQYILGNDNPFMLLTKGEPTLINMPKE